MTMHIEYRGADGFEEASMTVLGDTTFADLLRDMPGEVIVRPATPFEEVCDKIRSRSLWVWVDGSVLLPKIRPPEPDL